MHDQQPQHTAHGVQCQSKAKSNATPPSWANTASYTQHASLRHVHVYPHTRGCLVYNAWNLEYHFPCVITWILNVNALDAAAHRLRADSCLLLPPRSARQKKQNKTKHSVHFKPKWLFFNLLLFLKRKPCVSYPPCQNLVCFWTWQHPSSSLCFNTVRPLRSCVYERVVMNLIRFSCFCSTLFNRVFLKNRFWETNKSRMWLQSFFNPSFKKICFVLLITEHCNVLPYSFMFIIIIS